MYCFRHGIQRGNKMRSLTSLTKLGKINDVTQAELLTILGEGDVTVIFEAIP